MFLFLILLVVSPVVLMSLFFIHRLVIIGRMVGLLFSAWLTIMVVFIVLITIQDRNHRNDHWASTRPGIKQLLQAGNDGPV